MSVQLAYQSFTEQFNSSEVAIVKDSLGNLWLRATVACEKLEFSDAHRTVTTYCKPHQYQQFKVGNGRPALYVNESGFYRLTLKSKSVAAEEFIDWLTEDVLPKLRASGGYIMPNATSEQLEALKAEITTLKSQRDNMATLAYSGERLKTLINKVRLACQIHLPYTFHKELSRILNDKYKIIWKHRNDVSEAEMLYSFGDYSKDDMSAWFPYAFIDTMQHYYTNTEEESVIYDLPKVKKYFNIP